MIIANIYWHLLWQILTKYSTWITLFVSLTHGVCTHTHIQHIQNTEWYGYWYYLFLKKKIRNQGTEVCSLKPRQSDARFYIHIYFLSPPLKQSGIYTEKDLAQSTVRLNWNSRIAKDSSLWKLDSSQENKK